MTMEIYLQIQMCQVGNLKRQKDACTPKAPPPSPKQKRNHKKKKGNWKKIYTCPSTYEEQIYILRKQSRALVEINCASLVEHFQLNQSSYEE